jgi:hypothetical protein
MTLPTAVDILLTFKNAFMKKIKLPSKNSFSKHLKRFTLHFSQSLLDKTLKLNPN